jgi:hypothetical protein
MESPNRKILFSTEKTHEQGFETGKRYFCNRKIVISTGKEQSETEKRYS